MTQNEAHAQHDAYVRMARWALDQATQIRRNHGFQMTEDEREAWDKETHA